MGIHSGIEGVPELHFQGCSRGSLGAAFGIGIYWFMDANERRPTGVLGHM